MAILVEATSVIIRAQAIENKVSGGWERFRDALPTTRFCCDDELVSVIFIDPPDVTAFANSLPALGLAFQWQGRPIDVAFADQKRGVLTDCDWLEFDRLNLSADPQGPSIAICRLSGSQSRELRLPENWQYTGSLSERFGSTESAGI